MRRRILYVEDDPTGREVALFNLRRAGYDVTPASDGQEALSRFSLEKFDLVITDVRMPGFSGLELVRRIHRMVPCLPIIVITAFGGMETAVEAMRGGPATSLRSPSIGPISNWPLRRSSDEGSSPTRRRPSRFP